jgi:hypothetical protein
VYSVSGFFGDLTKFALHALIAFSYTSIGQLRKFNEMWFFRLISTSGTITVRLGKHICHSHTPLDFRPENSHGTYHQYIYEADYLNRCPNRGDRTQMGRHLSGFHGLRDIPVGCPTLLRSVLAVSETNEMHEMR